ncbi:hypothetical protein YobF, partial [Citrobacter freundii ATCC 8090 = MTCC 1658 = NBRC 12681]
LVHPDVSNVSVLSMLCLRAKKIL